VVGTAWSWVEGAPFTGANQAPVAADDSATTDEDAATTIAVLGNDSDADGDALTLGPVSAAAHGTATANADGTISYTPAANYSGADSFSYTVSDSQGGSATAVVSLTVTHINDAPVAAGDTATTNEDTSIAIAVLANDSDGDSGTLTPVVFNAPANGSVTVEADGTIRYTPAANFNGTDSFTYTVSDGAAESRVATVTITVQAVNDAPTVGADSYGLDEDATLQITDPGVLANDGDAEGDGLSTMLVTGPTHGTLTLNADGSFIYTPDANYSGADSFTYIANDGLVDSTAATVFLTVDAVNDTPVATDDSYSTNEDTALVIAAGGVLANDIDLDGDSLQVVMVGGPSHGALALNADGSFTYTPASNYNGPDSFSYKVSDASAESNVVTVTITVVPVNDAPIAGDESFTTSEDSGLEVHAPGVLANDTDADGGTLSAVLVSGPSHGTLISNADGSFGYTPAPNFNGTDSFTYRASDGAALSGVATVTITVMAVNDAPVATDDTFTATEDSVLNAAVPGVLANDGDADGEALTAMLVSGTSHGTLTFNANGSFGYTPAANYSGPDSFTYRVSAGGQFSAVATVTIAVNGVNDLPVARGESFTTIEDTPLVVGAPGVLGNDTDRDGDTLTPLVVVGPTRGKVTLNADGSFTYTPTADRNGTDKFTYRVNDGTANSNIVTVTISVTSVEDAPVAVDNTYSVNEESWVQVAAPGVLGNDRDGDGDALTAVLVSGPSHGTLVMNTNGLITYWPEPDFAGTDSFTYQVRADGQLSNVATVTLTVNNINDPPWTQADSYSTNANTPLTIAAPGVLANDIDIDSTTLTTTRVTDGAHGVVVLSADGGFTYTPDANYSGPDSFIYRARDSAGASMNGTVNIMVNAVAPISQANAFNGDTLQRIALTGTHAEGSALTFTILNSHVVGRPDRDAGERHSLGAGRKAHAFDRHVARLAAGDVFDRAAADEAHRVRQSVVDAAVGLRPGGRQDGA
jgi:VCBS repeat-containing protein